MHTTLLSWHDAKLREQEPRSDNRMAGELELFASGENAEACECVVFGGLLDENGFGKIHLAGDRLHGVIREAVAIGDHRQRIALKSDGGEDVEGVETSFHEVELSRWKLARRSDALELGDRPFIGDIPCVQSGLGFDED